MPQPFRGLRIDSRGPNVLAWNVEAALHGPELIHALDLEVHVIADYGYFDHVWLTSLS